MADTSTSAGWEAFLPFIKAAFAPETDKAAQMATIGQSMKGGGGGLHAHLTAQTPQPTAGGPMNAQSGVVGGPDSAFAAGPGAVMSPITGADAPAGMFANAGLMNSPPPVQLPTQIPAISPFTAKTRNSPYQGVAGTNTGALTSTPLDLPMTSNPFVTGMPNPSGVRTS